MWAHIRDENETFSWYLNVFPIIPGPDTPRTSPYEANRHKITGEASPTYFQSRHAATNIKKMLPHVCVCGSPSLSLSLSLYFVKSSVHGGKTHEGEINTISSRSH